jgi:hypothetical protein
VIDPQPDIDSIPLKATITEDGADEYVSASRREMPYFSTSHGIALRIATTGSP